MTTTVRYIGTLNPYFETAVTGKPGKWLPGTTADVDDTDAALLVATGLFDVFADRMLPFAVSASGAVIGVRMPDGTIQSLGSGGGAAGTPVPQFRAELAAKGFQPYIISATGTVLAGPCIFGWICCLTAGTITGLYDASSATGTNVMPGKAMTANETFGLLDEGDHNEDEGVLFDAGVHMVLASGTYEVWLRPPLDAALTGIQTVRAWNKYVVSADGSPVGLTSACRLRSLYCLTNGTIAGVYDAAGAATGTNLLPALAMTANTKQKFGRLGGRPMSAGLYLDVTGGTYLALAAPGV